MSSFTSDRQASGGSSKLVLRAALTGTRTPECADQMRDDVQRSLDTDLAALATMLESEYYAAVRTARHVEAPDSPNAERTRRTVR